MLGKGSANKGISSSSSSGATSTAAEEQWEDVNEEQASHVFLQIIALIVAGVQTNRLCKMILICFSSWQGLNNSDINTNKISFEEVPVSYSKNFGEELGLNNGGSDVNRIDDEDAFLLKLSIISV